MKESEDPESTRDFKIISGRVSDVRERVSESGFERADALRVMISARGSLTQSSGRAKSRGLLSLFSNPCRKMRICPVQTWMLGLWRKSSWILDSPWRHVLRCHKKGKVYCRDGADIPVVLTFHLSLVSRKGREHWASSVRKWSPCPGYSRSCCSSVWDQKNLCRTCG